MTVLPDGSIRVVWAAHPDLTSDNDIFAQTFTLPAVTPLPEPYDFTGFFQPVDNQMLNIATAGSAIPVKFSLGGDRGLAILAEGYPASSPIACDASEPGFEVTETVNAGSSSLSYNAASDQYSYVWKTSKAWRGTCRMLIVGFNDGTEH